MKNDIDRHNWTRPVRPNGPSLLHEYAIGVLYDVLQGDVPVRVKTRDGIVIDDLRVENGLAKVPHEYSSFMGVVPDLVIEVDGEPHTIIEIVVTSEPDRIKRTKLENIKRIGVRVVELDVPDVTHVADLVPRPPKRRLGGRGSLPGRHFEDAVNSLIIGLRAATPEVRREFRELMNEIDEEYRIPRLTNGNPKAKILGAARNE